MANRYAPLDERFWAKVRKTPTCWLWTGRLYGGGGGGRRNAAPRGMIWVNGKSEWASRAAWMLFMGPIPKGALVLHRCTNSHCVNPAHLYLGTYADNARDRENDGRTTRGERHPDARLTEQQVLELRARYAAGGVSYRQLGEEYGTPGPTVAAAVRGTTWKHLPKVGS